MLILKRHPGEGLILYTNDGEIYLDFDLKGNQIKVAIDAPDNVDVVREELQTKEITQSCVYDGEPGILSTHSKDGHHMSALKAATLAQLVVSNTNSYQTRSRPLDRAPRWFSA